MNMKEEEKEGTKIENNMQNKKTKKGKILKMEVLKQKKGNKG
jgi:hypothetical protein